MNFRSRRFGSQGGFILITLYMFLALMVAFAGVLAVRALADIRMGQRSTAGVQGFYLAEAGVDRAVQWLRQQPSPPPGRDPLVLFGGWQNLGEGRYLVSVDPADNNPVSFLKTYTIESWSAVGNPAAPLAVRRNRLVIRTESFSRYAYFTDNETSSVGARIWFITGDRIEGPTHTNGIFNMHGRPVFDGPVSSRAPTINMWGGGPPTTDPVFNGGLQLGADPIPFPGTPPNALIQAAGNGGESFTGDTQVTLLSNGTMRVTNSARRLNNQVMPLPGNGALYVSGGNLTLQGTLNGQLTIGTDRDVRIANPVVYAADPVQNPNSDDLMGIVAGRNVVVTSQAPQNVRIDAAIMALSTSFMVETWNQAPPRGILTLYGGVIQKHRGPVGTFDTNTGKRVTGYQKDYRYDTRLRAISPPFFPLTGAYEPVVWDENR